MSKYRQKVDVCGRVHVNDIDRWSTLLKNTHVCTGGGGILLSCLPKANDKPLIVYVALQGRVCTGVKNAVKSFNFFFLTGKDTKLNVCLV